MTSQEFQKQQNEKLLSCYTIEKAQEVISVSLKSDRDQLTQDFTILVSNLFHVQNLLEHCHRQTKNEPKHEALGDAYTSLSDLKDQIIEQIIGATGKNYVEINNHTISQYDEQMSNKAAELINVLANQTKEFSQTYNIPSIDNLSQELDAVGNLLKYKLSLNNDLVQKSFDIISKLNSI